MVPLRWSQWSPLRLELRRSWFPRPWRKGAKVVSVCHTNDLTGKISSNGADLGQFSSSGNASPRFAGIQVGAIPAPAPRSSLLADWRRSPPSLPGSGESRSVSNAGSLGKIGSVRLVDFRIAVGARSNWWFHFLWVIERDDPSISVPSIIFA